MTNIPVRRRNSFGKAMVLMLVVVIPIFVLQFTSGKDPGAAGYTAGYFAGAPIMAGFAVGIWALLAKSPWNWFA